ncbi:MAG: bifunctional enoyl-CoA hydratase/phosphate acetyltransferase [Candidatus Aegiribacteria sp.]|nr:bifunctional enoyl-CoA hydratase/phosphate acetyltransferase [Candidatus Aegiribacteria sp.]
MKPVRSLEELKKIARELPSKRVAVVRADEVETMSAIGTAVKDNMVEAVLIGPEKGIREAAEKADFDLNGIEIIHAEDDKTASIKGVEIVRTGKADVIMKGLVASSTFLRAILDREYGLRTPGVMSHVAAFDVPGCDKLLIVTDAAMNIAPDFEQKVSLLKNAITVAHALGIDHPKSTYVCAKEVPYEKMPCTMEAARMQELADAGEFGDIIFDAPLALDLAVSSEACRIKKIESPVGGDADILLLPDIEAANVLYKALIFIAGGELGAVIMGATNPVVLTSRADSAESKLCSIVLSSVVAGYQAGGGS